MFHFAELAPEVGENCMAFMSRLIKTNVYVLPIQHKIHYQHLLFSLRVTKSGKIAIYFIQVILDKCGKRQWLL